MCFWFGSGSDPAISPLLSIDRAGGCTHLFHCPLYGLSVPALVRDLHRLVEELLDLLPGQSAGEQGLLCPVPLDQVLQFCGLLVELRQLSLPGLGLNYIRFASDLQYLLDKSLSLWS